MLKRYPIIAGAILGVLLRLMFSGRGRSPWSAMAGAFIFMVPMLVDRVQGRILILECWRVINAGETNKTGERDILSAMTRSSRYCL